MASAARNFVAKHMNSFNKGGAHVDRKRQAIEDFSIQAELDELDEGWDFRLADENEDEASELTPHLHFIFT